MTKWVMAKETANIQLMSETLKISNIMAQVMVNRNVRTKNNAIRFLNPSLEFLHDPLLMKDMEKTIDVIISAVENSDKMVIYGDYDVDGITSSVILFKTLKAYGADVSFYIPDREAEGYGLNMEAVEKLHARGTRMIITCDNGIASVAEIERANELGMKVVIFDHHEPGEALPEAAAVVDPKQESCTYPFKMLCAAGICFKFAKAFYERVNMPFTAEKEFLTLAMLATFCDIVDLQGENRIIVKQGLDAINENKTLNLGLYALIKEKGFADKDINAFAVGFILGPCINATGRLEKATHAALMLVTEDAEMAEVLAKKLTELNEIRKEMTACAYEKIAEAVENTGIRNDAVMVIFDPDTHESIAGIVAGRLKERFHKPVIVLTDSGAWVKGSARSIESYNIFDAMSACKDLFERFGGHAMAAGVTLKPENIPILRQRLNESCTLTEDDFVKVITIDQEIALEEVTYALAEELKRLEPFGKANKEPLFLTKGLRVEQLRIISEKDTMIFTISSNGSARKIKGVCFGLTESFKSKLSALYDAHECEKIMSGILRNVNFTMDMVYVVDINEYNNSVSVQMKIKDFTIIKNEG